MIASLDHINITVRDLARTLDFYRDVLGMKVGPVPGMEHEPRAWIFAGDGRPAIHVGALLGRSGESGRGQGSAAIDHVAFACTDQRAVMARLEAAECAYQTNDVPAAKLSQVFVRDPDGILLELNFRAE